MFQEKYKKCIQKGLKKPSTLLALFLILSLVCGVTLAYLSVKTNDIKNTFTPSKITTQVEETFDGTTKSDVKIKNTGDTTAWIRAAVVITWQDKDGNVYSQVPVEDTDYSISYDLKNGWAKGDDGFYYWTKPVKSVKENSTDCYTGVLISRCTANQTAPDGYTLHVEIVCSGIQYKPANVFNENWRSSGFVVSEDGESLEVLTGGEGE